MYYMSSRISGTSIEEIKRAQEFQTSNFNEQNTRRPPPPPLLPQLQQQIQNSSMISQQQSPLRILKPIYQPQLQNMYLMPQCTSCSATSNSLEKQHRSDITTNQSSKNMEDFAHNIGSSMEDFTDEKINETTEEVIPSKNDSDSIEENIHISKIPLSFREPLIFLMVYILLSLPVVKKFIGEYIKQVNPLSDGNVPVSGIIIYGIIMVCLFMIIRKFLVK